MPRGVYKRKSSFYRKMSEIGKKRGTWMMQTEGARKKRGDKLRGRKRPNFSEEWRKNISAGQVGVRVNEKNHMWRGDDVKYIALHAWVARKLGKPMRCEICGTTENRKYEWSSKSHRYSRNLDDWQRLCTPCHRMYDLAQVVEEHESRLREVVEEHEYRGEDK